MKFLTFESEHGLKLGLKKNNDVIDVAKAASVLSLDLPHTPDQFLTTGLDALTAFKQLPQLISDNADCITSETDITLGSVVPKPNKILCVGLNYHRHALEANMPAPEQPMLFGKFNNSVAACNQIIDISGLEQVDYEAELAVVIGKHAKNISEANALDYILGYTVANDLSERALQFISGQWLIGKSLDGFLPLGPYLVTTDEIEKPQQLSIKGWLNGELRQSSNTSDMIFNVAEIISYASRIMTLEPGDVIITGTPEGVIMGRKEKKWLQAGDEYTIEIENLGRLTNKF